MKQISHIISTVFQPLLMPIYSIALLFAYTYLGKIYMHKFWVIMIPAFLYSFAIPAFFIYLLYKFKLISDVSLKVRRERFMPYIISLISYSVMIVHYYYLGMPQWFVMLCAGSVAVMVIAIVITIWWKISAHMFGVGGLVGGIMAVSYFVEKTNPYHFFMALFVMAGMVGTSRLILKRHTLSQVIAGFLLGFGLCFTFVWIGA